MANFIESTPNTHLHTQIAKLLEGSEKAEIDVFSSDLNLDLDDLRLLQRTIPDGIEDWQIKTSVSEQRLQSKSSKAAGFALRFTNLFFPKDPEFPDVTFSPAFISRFRSKGSTTKNAGRLAYLHVSEQSYEGTIDINGETFAFSPDELILRAHSAWLDSRGRQIVSGIEYTFVPHTGYITSRPFQEDVTEPLPFIDLETNERVNFAAVITAVAQLENS